MTKFIRDVWLVFIRQVTLILRNPVWIIVGIIQPLFFLLLFGPLVKGIPVAGVGGNEAYRFFVPGLLVQLAMFGTLFVGFALIAELRAGVIERMRVTPVSRVALLLGKVLASSLQAVVQAALIIVLAYLVFDLDAPFSGVLFSLLIVFLLAVSLASCSYALALTLKSEETFPAVLNAVLMPVLLLSGILIPITSGHAPAWLYTVSQINPFRHVVDVERSSFSGDFTMDALFTGCVVVVVLAAVSVWWGTRTFQRENA
jgi:ABC-2 type transport system permease protein